MKDIPKPMIIILVVVVILFVVAMLLGATHGDEEPGDASDPPSLVQVMERLFTDERRVRLEEVDADCSQDANVFQVSPFGCRITIAKTRSPVRQLAFELRSDSSSPVRLRLEQPERLTLDADIDPGGTFGEDVYRDGGTLIVSGCSSLCPLVLQT